MPLLVVLAMAVFAYIIIHELLRRIRVFRRPTPTSDSQVHTWGERAQWEYQTNLARYKQRL